MLTNYTPF